jgi:D-glycero-alpha-D-manno-heptose-7-phosphate kinase
VTPILMDNGVYRELEDNLMLFNTNIKRNTRDILTPQKRNMHKISESVGVIAELSKLLDNDLRYFSGINNLGRYLDKEWKIKKGTGIISNEIIDNYYNRAIEAGARGGKLCGAGMGGYLMLYCDKDKQDNVRKELSELNELIFKFDEYGSRIIYEG